MKKNATRKALFSSVLALVLCFSMLMGTTFAWFTDSAASANNIIQPGNLDVKLDYWDGDSYEEVTPALKLFDDNALWEPGHVEVAYLKVSNVGSLALKYQLNVNVFKETVGKTMAGADLKLSDHLVFGVVDKELTTADDMYSREEARLAAGDVKGLKAYNGATKSLEKDEAHYVALVIYMPAEVGNEANHDGVNLPAIEMGVNVMATQYTYEEDSFGPDYDIDAIYADHYVHNDQEFADLFNNNALEEGDTVALYAGTYQMPMNDTWWKATDLPKNVTLLGAEDGVMLTPVSNGSTDVGEQGRIQAEGYTFQNITFTNTVSPDGYGKFVNCTFDGYNGLRQGAYKQDTQFVNCVFNNADGWAFHTEYLYDADVYFENCAFNGLVEFTDTVATTDKVHFTSCAFLGSNRTSSGKIFYAWKNNAVLKDCAGYDASLFEGCGYEGITKTYVTDSAELKNAVSGGAKDVLAIGAEFDQKLNLGSDVNGTFVNCSFSGNNAWGYANNVTYENCTFESAPDVAAIHFDQLYGELVVKDCVFTSGKVQIGTDGSSSAVFENCVFGATEQTSIWSEKGMRFYCPTTFIGCEFNNRVVLAGSNDLPLTFENCTMNNGTPVYYVDNNDGIIRGGNIPQITIR